MRTRTLFVMAKEPVAGRVKTRLCPPCTAQEAADVAASALADTLAAVCAARADRRVLVLDGDAGPWVPPGVEVLPQRGEAFAERLAAGWSDVLADGGGRTVQIGMDTPQVTPALLDDALDRLERVPAVLGLAEDGGWWALGLRAAHAGLFVDVPMSADDTGERQAARVAALTGTAVEYLPLLRDVDHFDDALAVAALAPHGDFAASVRKIRR
jgi:rSAM/selenodomain-associated transferase 1